MTVFLVVGGIATIMGGLLISYYRKNKQRIEDLRHVAARLNLSFDDADPMLAQRLDHFHIFSQGRRKTCKNVMRGRTTDLDIILFDYQYTTGSGKNSSTHRLTIILFEAANEHIPIFSLRPEHLFHKLGQVFGYQDIDFDSHPEFSKKYLLRGPNEEPIREVFSENVLDYFQAHPGASVEASSGQLIYYPTRQRVDAEDLEQLLTDAVRIYALFTT